MIHKNKKHCSGRSFDISNWVAGLSSSVLGFFSGRSFDISNWGACPVTMACDRTIVLKANGTFLAEGENNAFIFYDTSNAQQGNAALGQEFPRGAGWQPTVPDRADDELNFASVAKWLGFLLTLLQLVDRRPNLIDFTVHTVGNIFFQIISRF